MNKLKISLICLLFFFSINIFAGKPVYTIKVKFTNLKDTVCYLGNYYGDKSVIRDTGRVDSKGLCTFQGDEKLAGGIYLLITPTKKYFEFIFDRDMNISFEADTTDFVGTLKIKGSPDNQLFYDYLRFISKKAKEADPLKSEYKKHEKNSDSAKAISEKLNKLDKEVKKYKLDFIASHPDCFLAVVFNASYEPELPEAPLLENGQRDSNYIYRYYRQHYLDKVDLSDDRLIRTPVFYNKLKTFLTQLTIQHPDSVIEAADYLVSKTNGNKEMFKYIVWYITNYSETSNIMGFDAIFVHMVEKYYMTNQAFWVNPTTLEKITTRAKILKNLLLGAVAPNLTVQDTSLVYQTLYNVKSKYTILYFWDPTCGHCQKETPKLKDLYDEIHDKGVEVFAVCTDPNIGEWKKYIIEHKLNWLNVMDIQNVTGFHTIYDIYSTPVVYLLDENKIILAKRLSVDQLDAFLEKTISNGK
jgi:peroxiredoxin